MTDMHFGVGEIEAELLQGIAIVLLSLVTAGAKTLLARLKLSLTAAQRAELEEVAEKSLSWAVNKSLDEIRARGWDHVTVKGEIIDEAVTYCITRFWPTLKANKLKTNDPKLVTMIERKLPAAAALALATVQAIPAPECTCGRFPRSAPAAPAKTP